MPTLTIVPNDVVRRFVFVPEGHEQRRPETVNEVLARAHDVLQDEERWTTGRAHEGLNGPDDPFCGSWRACAIGSVGLVTLGVVDDSLDRSAPPPCWRYKVNVDMPTLNPNEDDRRAALLYGRSTGLLDVIAGARFKLGIVGVNDDWGDKGQNRQNVLRVFKDAMTVARLFEFDNKNDWNLYS